MRGRRTREWGFRGWTVTACLLAAYAAYNLLSVNGLAEQAPTALHVLAALLLLMGTLGTFSARTSLKELANQPPTGYMTALRMLASAVDAGDSFARGRSYRISRFSARIAEHMGLSERDVEDVECAALLHDIGRTAIHLDVLNRPHLLSSEERAVIRTHPGVSYEILKHIPFLARAAEIAYAHHEQPDGKGYPRGLLGEAIPKGSRIIMVAATFDSMTSDSPYRQALSTAEACGELRAQAGTQFFPDVVAAISELVSTGALFDGLDFRELSTYTSGQATSRAIEEYLHSDAARARGLHPVEAPAAPPIPRPDYEIDLPPDSDDDRGEEIA